MATLFKRSILKKQYERFCEAWQNEKRYQQYLLNTGEKLPEGHNQLGKKPTFNMWLRAVKNKQIAQEVNQPVEAVVEEKKVEVTDTEW